MSTSSIIKIIAINRTNVYIKSKGMRSITYLSKLTSTAFKKLARGDISVPLSHFLKKRCVQAVYTIYKTVGWIYFYFPFSADLLSLEIDS